MSLPDEIAAGPPQPDQTSELRFTIRRLQRDLEQARAKREELVNAVYRAALDAAQSLNIEPVAAPPRDKRQGKPEVAICLLADWQWGKVTPAYSSDVAAARITRYGEKVVKLIANQRAAHPINEARIYLLGDLIEGEEILGINTYYELTLYCNGEIVDGSDWCGEDPASQPKTVTWCKTFEGNDPDEFNAEVIPNYPSSSCYVVEHVYDGAVEVDNGCQRLTVSAGQGDSCTIVNTVFFEGIPALNTYGLALLALAMLGVGPVGFRRFA